MANRDEMSFKNAFADARRELGAGKTFTWRGNRYTTDYAEESSRAPRRSPTPTARPSRSESSGSTERAPRRSPTPTPRPSPVERARSGEMPRMRSTEEIFEELPRRLETQIRNNANTESEERRARRAAVRSIREGESTDFISRMLRDLFAGFRERQDRARQAGREQSGRNQRRNERLNEMRGMNKGGTVRSGKMDRRKSGMFYDSKSPRGYK